MMRSMYSGVSGLRTHQLKMDVIGNNIANVNTVGFKKSQISFQEVFSQTSSGASAPQGGRGGTNPQQVGLGVNVGSIRVIHEPGSAQRTDNPLDFTIAGDGYFVVSGDSNFNNRSYTRAGNFDLDRDGTLVTGEGLKVLGYKVDNRTNPPTVSDTLGDIRIDKSSTKEPTTTKNLEIKGNLNANAEVGSKFSTDTKVYDSLGNPYIIKFEYKKETSGWIQSINGFVDSQGNDLLNKKDKDGKALKDANGDIVTVDLVNLKSLGIDKDGNTDATPIIEFDSEGKLKPINISDGVSEEDKKRIIINMKVTDKGREFVGNATFAVGAEGKEEEGYDFKLDLENITQYGNDTTAKAYREDGETSGVIDSFSVSRSGEIVAVYTNGESKVLAQVALAKFDNPGGLSKEGSNLFKDTRNSGEPQYGKAGASGYGQMLGGAVEMSNVDLSNEFTEMITTQRGFQANSRIITTSDEMLQELVNLKR